MTLALGLAASFVGACMTLAGFTNRPLSRLLYGYWDAPGTTTPAGGTNPPGTSGTRGANASTGGTYAPPAGPQGPTGQQGPGPVTGG
jgi:hypothetical protein